MALLRKRAVLAWCTGTNPRAPSFCSTPPLAEAAKGQCRMAARRGGACGRVLARPAPYLTVVYAGSESASADAHESIKALALLQHQVEVLFVMCTLLAGKRKAQVQDRLMALQIVPALLKMFDRLDWNRAPSTTPPMERIHGPGCECNPESALRIQYLRLVHNLSDRETDEGHMKHLLLSEAEMRSVQGYARFDALKQFVFIGGGNRGDGVLRCPAAAEVQRLDLQVGHANDKGYSLREGLWDEALTASKGCQHYLINSPQGAAGTKGTAAGEEHWTPPSLGPRARLPRASDAGAHREREEEDTDVESGVNRMAAANGGCLGGEVARRTPPAAAAEPLLPQALPPQQVPQTNAAARAMDGEEAGASGAEHRRAEDVLDSRADDVFGHVSLGARVAGNTSTRASSRRDSPCLSSRRVQEGAGRPARSDPRSTSDGGGLMKEEDQGLISRILHVFMRETPDSTYRCVCVCECVRVLVRAPYAAVLRHPSTPVAACASTRRQLSILLSHHALLHPALLALDHRSPTALTPAGRWAMQLLASVVCGGIPARLRHALASADGTRGPLAAPG
jgi:hypothetical protein